MTFNKFFRSKRSEQNYWNFCKFRAKKLSLQIFNFECFWLVSFSSLTLTGLLRAIAKSKPHSSVTKKKNEVLLQKSLSPKNHLKVSGNEKIENFTIGTLALQNEADENKGPKWRRPVTPLSHFCNKGVWNHQSDHNVSF